MYKYHKFQELAESNNLKVRPNASSGIWLIFLLPSCILRSVISHPLEASNTYKLCSVFAFGLVVSSISVVQSMFKEKLYTVLLRYWLAISFTTITFYVCTEKGFLFCLLSSAFANLGFRYLYFFLINHLPNSFSLGEAAVVAQGILLFVYSALINLSEKSGNVPGKDIEIATVLIQVGLTAVGIICFLTYSFQSLRKTTNFYITFILVVTFFLFIPLHVLLMRSPLLWIFYFIFDDFNLIKVFFFWVICGALAVYAVNWKVKSAQRATTGVRKIFHVLAVACYLPGLVNQCTFLYLSTGVVLGIFIFFEILRVLNIPPLGYQLQNGFTIFSDEKDMGPIALTPIYLLVGCALPIWIHPSPCDVTDSAGFNALPLLSGILTIGIGDTAASVVGSTIGRVHIPGSRKTIEGTLACALSQLAVLILLVYYGFFPMKLSSRVYTAVVVSSIIEAKTSQIDNLVLPLVFYMFVC